MKHKQKLAVTLMAAALAAAIAIPALAASVMTIDVEPDVKVYVDDMPIDAGETHGNPEAFIYNGTTYIAAKAVSLSLDENVKWDGGTRSVYIGKHEGSSYLLMDVCPPYQNDYGIKALKTVTMAGKQYTGAIRVEGGSALFNLGGKYDTLSFDLGHIDGEGMDTDTISIYLDGELAFAVEPDPEAFPVHYEVPLNGALQMKIEGDWNTYQFALANVRVS